jgi:hypothetical protein
VDDADERAVCADTQGQHAHNCERNSRLSPEDTTCVAGVTFDRLEEGRGSRLAVRLARLLRTAEANVRLPPSLVTRKTASLQFFGGFVEVRGDLVLEIAVEVTSTKQGPQARGDASEPAHDSSVGMLKKRPMMPVVCSQAADSTDS